MFYEQEYVSIYTSSEAVYTRKIKCMTFKGSVWLYTGAIKKKVALSTSFIGIISYI